MIYYISNNTNSEFLSSTLEECLNYFKNETEIQIDTETEYNTGNPKSLPNPHNCKVLSLQLGDSRGDNQYVIDMDIFKETEDLNKLKQLFEDENITKVFTNAFFDIRFILHWSFNISNIYDCFLTEMSLTLGKEMPAGYRGLGQMTERYCGIKLNKEIRGQIHYRGLDTDVIRYAAEDVKYMSEIKRQQEVKIKELSLENEIKLNNRFAITLANISYKGFKIDISRWIYNVQDNENALGTKLKELNIYLEELKDPEFLDETQDLLDEEPRYKLNWNSSKQVVSLFKKLGINTIARDKKTGKDKDSVDAKHLIRQKNKFPILVTYLEYKELQKEISTYGMEFIKDNVNKHTGKVHSEFFPLLATGRISSSNPNLQNITSKDSLGNPSVLRQCFVPDSADDVLIIADYSQQEPRLTAEYSQDPFLIDFILNGDGDSHSLTATAISSYLIGEEVKVSKSNNPLVPKYGKKIRDIGKMISLGLDYGKTAFSVKDDLGITQEEAQTLIDLLKSKTPKKQKYFEECTKFVKENGYIRIDKVTNRISYFKEYDRFIELSSGNFAEKTKANRSEYAKLKGYLERFAANFPIQGSAGSMTKIAAILTEDELKKKNYSQYAWIVNSIHDELVLNCNKNYAEEIKEIVNSCMIQAGNLFCKTIPTVVDINIGENWGAKT